MLLLLVGILIPNALYLGAVLAGVGTPPRPGAIIAYLAVAVIARAFGRGAAVAAYLFVLTYDLINTVSLLFGLSFLEIAAALTYARELQLLESPLYMAMGLVVALSSMLIIWILTAECGRLRQARLIPALLGAAALVVIDLVANTSPHYHFGSAFAAGQPFESAVKASGFEAVAASGERRNLLLIVVEGLGEFADPTQQARLTAPFDDPALRRHYRVTRGAASYFGSTTAAEMRELCATRAPYSALLEGTGAARAESTPCLPTRLVRLGYRTVGVHGFTGAMFERTRWWPRIGLQEAVFGEQLVPPLPVCGAVFYGACDSAIVGWLRQRLREGNAPQFIYWLTLNTHIPVKPGEHSGRFTCGDGDVFGAEMVCHMAAMWNDVFRGIVRLALDPDLPPTEILIVGDHVAPLWSRRDRALFKPGLVSWIRLARKDGAAGAAP